MYARRAPRFIVPHLSVGESSIANSTKVDLRSLDEIANIIKMNVTFPTANVERIIESDFDK